MLTELQQKTLMSFAECIVPTDDLPGAGSAETVSFIKNLLVGDRERQYPEFCRFLDELHRLGFADASPTEKNRVLAQWESTSIFRIAAELVMESYWTSAVGKSAVGFVEIG